MHQLRGASDGNGRCSGLAGPSRSDQRRCEGLAQRADTNDLQCRCRPVHHPFVLPGAARSLGAKPSRAASRRRRSRPPIGRSSPVRPISPHSTVPGRDRPVAQRRGEREGERQVDRRLLDGQAADDAGVDVVAGQVEPGPAAEHGDAAGSGVACRVRHRPPRRAVDLRRDERLDLDQQRPAALEGGRDGDAGCAERVGLEERRGGSATSIRPSAVISKTPTSSVEPKRFLLARSRRRPEKRSPSSVSTTSTRCSSVLGPASVPSLVTWPTRITGTPCSLANAWRRAAAARTWPTEPAGPSSSSVVSVWIESTMSSAGCAGVGGSDDALDARSRQARRCRRRRAAVAGQAEARGAQSDLGGRLLARRVQDAAGRARPVRRTAPARASTCRSPARRRAGPASPARGRRRARDRPRGCRPAIRLGVSRRRVAPRASRRRRGDGARAPDLPRSAARSTRRLDEGVPGAAGAALALPSAGSSAPHVPHT